MYLKRKEQRIYRIFSVGLLFINMAKKKATGTRSRITKNAETGMFHVGGGKFEILRGTRLHVWRGKAYKTRGGLTKKDLFQDDSGKIKSVSASKQAKRTNNLGEHKIPVGFGEFVAGGVKKGKK